MTTDTGIKFKVETSPKERDQQLLDFISIDTLKLEHKNTSEHHQSLHESNHQYL